MSGGHSREKTLLERVNGLAAVQDGLITRQQLLDVGLSTHSIERRRRNGLLVWVHAGVYRIGPVGGPLMRERGALLACGGGVLSHVTAAVLSQLLPESRKADAVHVTLLPLGHARHRNGIRAHRGTLARDEITSRNGLPLTTPARTLLDLAALATNELERGVACAEHHYPRIRDDVLVLLDRYPRGKGSRILRALIMDGNARSFTRSEAEELLISLVRSGGLPKPETNVKVCGYEVDCYWRRARLVVEIDGYEFHGSKRAFIRDRQRDIALAAAGIRVIRLSWHQLTKERDQTLVQLALALAMADAVPATLSNAPPPP